MSVGQQATKAGMDQNLTMLAVQLRSVMQQIVNEWNFVNNGAQGSNVVTLAAIGYDNTDETAPGGLTDAAYASYLLNTMHTVAQVYYGQAAQPAAYDTDTALSPLTAGQT
jgi:hypothetical protein